MKGLLIISFVLLVLLQIAIAQQSDCRLIQGPNKVTLNVNWCSQPVIATLPEEYIGYCSNARCKSSHEVHRNTERVTRGKQFALFSRHMYMLCYRTLHTKGQ